MLNLKRFICVILMLTMVSAFLLTGCSDGDKTNSGSKKGSPVINAYFLAPSTMKDIGLVEAEVNKILKDKIDATIKLNYVYWDSYQERQKLIINSGEEVDLLFAPEWYGFASFVSQKAFLELDDLLDKYGKGIKENIPAAYLDAPRAGGKLYGIPTAKDMTSVGGVLYNKKMADKYSFDLSKIKTPADFEPMLKTIKEKEPDIAPFLSQRGDMSAYFMKNFYEYILQIDVPIGIKKDEGKPVVCNLMEVPEYKEMVNLFNNWFKKGYLNNDVATVKDTTPAKKAQKAFMWGEQLKPGKADEKTAEYGYEIAQANAYENVQPYANTPDLTNSMFAIPRSSKNPEAAMKFLNETFTNKELRNLLSWGIEGKHYKKIGENQIDFADGVDAKTSGYTGLPTWALPGNQFLDYLWASEKTDKWDKMKEFNDSAKISKTVGWTFDQKELKTEIAALVTVSKQYGPSISSGIVSYDTEYPKMKKAMDNAGLDKVIKEAQKQLDQFVKNNK